MVAIAVAPKLGARHPHFADGTDSFGSRPLVPRKSLSNRVIVHSRFRCGVMSRKVEVWDPGEIARRWRGLAERRRAYLIELYRSGRWKRYYNEQEFLTCVRT